ncbi:MAG TPA: sulfotransferase family 2 domain-containing protein [Polyangia bacterium]
MTGQETARLAAAYVLERYRNLEVTAVTPALALFGAGWFARGFLSLLRQHGLPLPAVIIDEAKGQTPVFDIPVIGINDAIAAGWNRPDRKVLIAINQRVLAGAIEERLRDAGFAASCLIPPDLCPLAGWEENAGTDEPQAQPELIIFHHVPKCGGTSFTSLLRNYFGHNFIDINNPADWRRCERFVAERRHARRICAAGHDALGLHELAGGRRVRYVTLLRHPWQRFISSINFRVGYGAHVDQVVIPRNDLIANFSERRSLGEAKETLDRWFESVGVLERYDEAVRLLAHQLQLPTRFEHSNKSRDWRTSALTDLRPRFEERNQDDIAFYEYARARFERDLAASPQLRPPPSDDPVPVAISFQDEPDGVADEMKVARQSGNPEDLLRAHQAFFSRIAYGDIPCAIALEHSRLMRAAGRPDLALFWHHGAVQPTVRTTEYALCLGALDPHLAAALALHVELVRLGRLGENPIAVTLTRTRKRWQTELHRHLLRAHIWRLLHRPDVLKAPAIYAGLDEVSTEALREVATRLGFGDRLRLGKDASSLPPDGAVVLLSEHAGETRSAWFEGLHIVSVPPVPEPDWPYFAEHAREKSAPGEPQPTARRA